MKMRKNTRRLLAAVLAVAVLGGAYAALLLNPQQDETEDDSTTVALVSIDSDDLASVHVTLRDGSSDFTLNFTSDDTGTTYEMASGETDADYSETLMQTLMSAASAVSAQLVEEDCDDLSKYSLSDSDEVDTIVITDTDDNTVTITFGLVSDVLGTYCTVDGGSDVYLMDTDSADALIQPQSYYRNLTVLGGYYSLSSEMTSLSFEMRDGTAVAVSTRDTSDMTDDEADAYSSFIFTEPLSCDADDSAFTSAVLSDLQSGLTAESIVEDDPDDLSQYGLDDPIEIHLTCSNLDATVLVGDTTDDDGIYLMLEGDSTVFLSSASYFDFLDEDWSDWRSTTLLPCAMTQVDSIVVTQDDTTNTVDFTQVEADENEDADEDTTTATLDGEDMTDDALEQFFLAITSVNYTRLVDDPEEADASITVTVTLTDGTVHTMSFTKGGSREYLVDLDGSGYVYGVHQDDVTSILESLTTGSSDDTEDDDSAEGSAE